MSYNPSYRDHQNLLQEVANKELTLIKEEKHLKRVTTKMFSRVTEDEKEVSRFVRQHIKKCDIYKRNAESNFGPRSFGLYFLKKCDIYKRNAESNFGPRSFGLYFLASYQCI
jgi:hypothetical protein